jgi:cation transport ATPase
VVKKYKELGEKVVYIGDGNNDMEAMRISDISIAAGLIHYPANSILTVADYLIFNEEALCRQLNQLL